VEIKEGAAAFFKLAISSMYQFINLPFHQHAIQECTIPSTSNFMSMPLCQLASLSAISSTQNLSNLLFDLLTISSTCHLINLPFYQPAISSAC
jgi:hypothetical protein